MSVIDNVNHITNAIFLFKYQLLSWENIIKYRDSMFIFKILHGLGP